MLSQVKYIVQTVLVAFEIFLGQLCVNPRLIDDLPRRQRDEKLSRVIRRHDEKLLRLERPHVEVVDDDAVADDEEERAEGGEVPGQA